MSKFMLRRVVQMFVVLFIVSVIIFVGVRYPRQPL